MDKLTQEDKDALRGISAEGIKALYKALDIAVYDQERSVMSLNLETADTDKLAFSKCRAEGAKKACAAIKTAFNRIRNDKK